MTSINFMVLVWLGPNSNPLPSAREACALPIQSPCKVKTNLDITHHIFQFYSYAYNNNNNNIINNINIININIINNKAFILADICGLHNSVMAMLALLLILRE